MQNARLDEAKAEIKTARGSINNLRNSDDTILMSESEEEPLDEEEPPEEDERVKNLA